MLRATMAAAASNLVLVTGGNSGIGYEAVKALLSSKKPHHVLLGSRTLDKAQNAIETLRKEVPETTNSLEALEVDLTSDTSIEKAAEQVKAKHGRLDTLINNAGATFDLEFVAGRTTLREAFNRAYDVNVAGTNVITWTFIPLLLKSKDPRLIFVSGLSGIVQASEKYYPTPDQPAGWPKPIDFETIGYRSSKCALNMLMLDYSHKLKADNVKVWGILPGMLVTNLGGVPELGKKFGAGHASIGGEFLRRVAEGERDDDAGHLIDRNGRSRF